MSRIILATIAALCLAACGSGSKTTIGGPEVGTRRMVATHPVFHDIDPHEWQGRTPRHYPVHGIDVSRYQGSIDWSRVRGSGVTFAFIKATEGGDHVDPRFLDHWTGARRAGVRHGAYHYYYFCRPAEQQARWFIQNVPRDANALPHVLDMEWNHLSRTCRYRPDGATVRREAMRFLDILQRHYGRRPVVYTTVDFYRETGIGQLPNTHFWLRSVAGHPSEVYPGADWAFWQYTSTGVVPGVDGPVDINVFAGSPQSWQIWAD